MGFSFFSSLLVGLRHLQHSNRTFGRHGMDPRSSFVAGLAMASALAISAAAAGDEPEALTDLSQLLP